MASQTVMDAKEGTVELGEAALMPGAGIIAQRLPPMRWLPGLGISGTFWSIAVQLATQNGNGPRSAGLKPPR